MEFSDGEGRPDKSSGPWRAFGTGLGVRPLGEPDQEPHGLLHGPFRHSPILAFRSYNSEPPRTHYIAMTLIAIFIVAFVAHWCGVYVMTTDSAARRGVYRVRKVPFARGSLVAACLPLEVARFGLARGYLGRGVCAGGAEPVAKIIGAVAGDRVEVWHDEVIVNGQRIANSNTHDSDSQGRRLPHPAWGPRSVRTGEAWLFGFNDPRSWDSRYWGPIPTANVLGVLNPEVIW